MSNIDDTNLGGTDGLGGQPSDLGADANSFEQGTGDPVGAGTVETPNVDGGRPDGAPDEDATSDDPAPRDPVDAAAESKQTVVNDAVAGEPVEGAPEGDDPGIIEPVEGVGDDEENRAEFDATDGLAEDAPDQIQTDPDGDVANR
ncbi:hypothetical protein [Salinibacterium sp. GXW1014]|uniref:hypothetical protein n=1 Tax=Salinibacterium sp. GXW1014 TaxID=3377838 RepID=UPI00383A35F3